MRMKFFDFNKKKSKIYIFILVILILSLTFTSINILAFADTGNQEDTEKPNEFVNKIYLQDDEIGDDGEYHFVGEDFDKAYKTLSIEEKGKTIKLDGYYTTNKSKTMHETTDSSSPLGNVQLSWKSSNNSIAKVDPTGYITPLKDGEVTITATVSDSTKYEGTAPSKSVTIKISGQSGKYVRDVTIIDKNGKILGGSDGALTTINGKNKFFDFYALVTWCDPSSGTEKVEDTRKDKISSKITWLIGGSNVAGSINKDTGRFKSSEYSANCYVQCVVTGGKGGKEVKDTANIQVDTGSYAYRPSDSLTLNVVYQKVPNKVVQKHTYSLSTLSNRLNKYTHNYTILGGPSRYGVIRAKGFLFKDVVKLENIDIDDVYQYRFKTADGYDNPITSKLLYGSGARYYFPNWNIGGPKGGSKAGATVVPPLLATESNLIWGETEVSSNTNLDMGTRFRLVYGPLWEGESNSSNQIYYIKEMTIVLNGAPPANNGKGGKHSMGDNDGKDKGDKDGSGSSIGNGSDGNGTGGNGTGKNGGLGTGNGSKDSRGGGSGGSGNLGKAVGKSGFKTAINNDEGGGWSAYEMISNSKSNVNSINMDMPYLPVAIPIGGAGIIAGSVTSLVSFRRRML